MQRDIFTKQSKQTKVLFKKTKGTILKNQRYYLKKPKVLFKKTKVLFKKTKGTILKNKGIILFVFFAKKSMIRRLSIKSESRRSEITTIIFNNIQRTIW